TIKRSLHNTSYKLTDRHRANRQGARLSQRPEHPYIPPNDLTEFNHRWTQMNTQKRSSKNQGPSARGAPKIMVETLRQGAFETWSLALLRWQKFGGWCFFHPEFICGFKSGLMGTYAHAVESRSVSLD